MKRILIAMSMLLMLSFGISVYAQEVLPESNEISQIVIDLSSFTGIVAFVSLIVTQVVKLIPTIDSRAIFKVLSSIAVGCLATFISWRFSLAELLNDLQWWQMLIQGAIAGLTASGAYDLIKSAIGKKE